MAQSHKKIYTLMFGFCCTLLKRMLTVWFFFTKTGFSFFLIFCTFNWFFASHFFVCIINSSWFFAFWFQCIFRLYVILSSKVELTDICLFFLYTPLISAVSNINLDNAIAKIHKIEKNIGDFNSKVFIQEMNKTTTTLSKQLEYQGNKITKLNSAVT